MTFAEKALSSSILRTCGFLFEGKSLGWLCSLYCIDCIALKEIGIILSGGYKSLPANFKQKHQQYASLILEDNKEKI